jgi:hypothetical protein
MPILRNHFRIAGNTGTWTFFILPQAPPVGNRFVGRAAKLQFSCGAFVLDVL